MWNENFKDKEDEKKIKFKERLIDIEKQKQEIKDKLKKIIEKLWLQLNWAIDVSKLLEDLNSLDNLANLKELKDKIERIIQKLNQEQIKIMEELFTQLENLFAWNPQDGLLI